MLIPKTVVSLRSMLPESDAAIEARIRLCADRQSILLNTELGGHPQ